MINIEELIDEAIVIRMTSKSNHGYLMFFTLTMLCGSTLQGGWAAAECGQVGLVLDKKLGWNSDQGADTILLNNVTLVTVLASLGLAIGCQIGGYLLPKYGGRKMLIAANAIAFIFNLVKLIENTVCIMIGRLVFGITMGVTTICLSRSINDTVPMRNSQFYGGFVNAGFCAGAFLSNLMGLLIPLDNGQEGDVEKMLADENWRLVLGFPLILQIYSILVLTFVIKHVSIIDLLQHEEPDSELLH